MKLSKRFAIVIIVLAIAAVAVTGFAALLYTKTLTGNFVISHSNVVLYSDIGLTGPITVWPIGTVTILDDVPQVVTQTYWLHNIGQQTVQLTWTVTGLASGLTLNIAQQSGLIPGPVTNDWAQGVGLSLTPDQERTLTFSLSVPTTAADGASSFTINFAVEG